MACAQHIRLPDTPLLLALPQHNLCSMAPSTIALNDIVTSAKDDWKDKDDWTFSDYWRAVGDWFARFFRGVNHESKYPLIV